MKLLFDENLSPKLVLMLEVEFPGSAHVGSVLGRRATDQEVWEYAGANAFAIVSKDTDFRDRSMVRGHPPKVVWLDIGNAGTAVIARLLKRERERIETFEKSRQNSFLILT